MGSSVSKVARTAGNAARKYPTRLPPPPSSANAPPHQPPAVTSQHHGPAVHPEPRALTSRTEPVNLDASDPDFAAHLRTLGPVQPNPTFSNSSTFSANPNTPLYTRSGPDPRKNPAVLVLEARARLQDEADQEFQQAGRRGHEGRQFLDVYMLRQMLILRDRDGKSAGEVERRLGLKKGVVGRLGSKGVVGLASELGRAEKGVQIV